MGSLTATICADFKKPNDVRISPDASHVVYTLPESSRAEKHVKSSLWVAETGQASSARQITSGKFFDDAPRFAPDGAWIAFLSDRDNRGTLSSLYKLPMKQFGEAQPVTVTTNKQSIVAFEWSPDGKYIAYLSADEKTEEEKRKEEEGDDPQIDGQNLEHARLRIIDVVSGETRTLVSRDAHIGACSWNSDSTALAYLTRKGSGLDDVYDSGDICIVQVQDSESVTVCHLDLGATTPTWIDNKVFWIAPTRGSSQSTSRTLWSADAKLDSRAKAVAYGHTDCATEVHRCGTRAAVRVLRGLSDHLELVPSMENLAALDRDVGGGWDVGFEGKTPVIVYVRASLTGAEVVSRKGGEEVQLSQHETVSENSLLNSTERIEFKAEDGTPIDGVLYQPVKADKASELPATVVLVHGGPYSRAVVGASPSFPWAAWFLAHGYAVLTPNYRGGSGHGAAYAETVQGNAAASYEDVITMVKKCIADGKIDEKKTAIVGWSQGGFMSYLAVTRSSTFHFAAAVAGAGVSCWDTMAMTSDVPILEAALGGTAPWLAPIDSVTARRSSPLWHMDSVSTPLLILHGEEDVRVPVSQARSFHNGMKARGKSAEMIIYPREGHGGHPKPFERAHQIHRLESITTFLAKHLK